MALVRRAGDTTNDLGLRIERQAGELKVKDQELERKEKKLNSQSQLIGRLESYLAEMYSHVQLPQVVPCFLRDMIERDAPGLLEGRNSGSEDRDGSAIPETS
jgi:hypothetical protein